MFEPNHDYQAYLDDITLIVIEAKDDQQQFIIKDYNQKSIPYTFIKTESVNEQYKYYFQLDIDYDFTKEYYVYNSHGHCQIIKERGVIQTSHFEDIFYTEQVLGNVYSKNATTFYVWAPISKEVKLLLSHPSTWQTTTYDMERDSHGVFSLKLNGNFECYSYKYLLKHHGKWVESVDPYAKASLINSQASVIIDIDKTRNLNLQADIDHLDIHQAIIYEMHVRDFSIHPKFDFKNKGKFLAFLEEGLQNTYGEKIGIDYITSLGITHIQFLPIYDFSSVSEFDEDHQYNWGYDPQQYNVVEGRYATNPYDCYNRIIELKTMIEYIKSQGIGIIMDVVYNHVYNPSTHAFEKIVPGYFFRLDDNFHPINGSGTGNDIATERKMVRKYIVDSLSYWLDEFKLNGFRFDLMGLFDIDLMHVIARQLQKIQPNVYLYGEGWKLESLLHEKKMATISQAKQIPEYGFFNDQFRDLVKGSTFDTNTRGLASGNPQLIANAEKIVTAFVNHVFATPKQSINYVTCHDNHTLFDRLTFNLDQHRLSYQKLCYSFILLSQGIPFLHFGCEFSRSKQGIDNSYKSSDQINQIDWDLISTNKELVNYVKTLISFRKKYLPIFTNPVDLKHHIQVHNKNDIIIYRFQELHKFNINAPFNQLIVLFNVGKNLESFTTTLTRQILLEAQLPIIKNRAEVTIPPYTVKVLAE